VGDSQCAALITAASALPAGRTARRRADRASARLPGYGVNVVASRAIRAYQAAMFRYFDMTDHARLPQRFSRENRSVLARLR